MATTFTKLKSGEWGLRVEGSATAGQVVTVSKRDGTTDRKVVGKVIWSGNGISLCTIAEAVPSANGRPTGRFATSNGERAERNRYPRTGCSCGSRDGYPQDSDCWTCRHDSE